MSEEKQMSVNLAVTVNVNLGASERAQSVVGGNKKTGRVKKPLKMVKDSSITDPNPEE